MAALLDLQAREGSLLAEVYARSIRRAMEGFEGGELGAVILEPVLMGAAGMLLVDPLFQRLLALEGRRRGLPLVFDEVASGLYRLGRRAAASILGVQPDIACYGKTLTGGYLPLALTLTTEAVFDSFKVGACISNCCLRLNASLPWSAMSPTTGGQQVGRAASRPLLHGEPRGMRGRCACDGGVRGGGCGRWPQHVGGGGDSRALQAYGGPQGRQLWDGENSCAEASSL
jgi:hypothetical protein